MTSERTDLVDLFDAVWDRFGARLDGLTDAELAWEPLSDGRVSLHWRLAHVTELLTDDRNAEWLGVAAEPPEPDAEAGDGTAVSTLVSLVQAYQWWRDVLSSVPAEGLAAPLGPAAGPYASSSRRSFVLHVADELIHHTAEAALLRDLYAGRG